MEVFAASIRSAPLIVAEAVWQYSHHVLHGLISHRGPILTVANWSGTWPGLVGMLNLNGSLTKAGVKYSTLWSEDFTDPTFCQVARTLARQREAAAHDRRTSRRWHDVKVAQGTAPARRGAGRAIAAARKPSWACSTKAAWACSTPSFPTNCCNPTGVYKERLSQSALYYETTQVSDDEARAVRRWLEDAA